MVIKWKYAIIDPYELIGLKRICYLIQRTNVCDCLNLERSMEHKDLDCGHIKNKLLNVRVYFTFCVLFLIQLWI